MCGDPVGAPPPEVPEIVGESGKRRLKQFAARNDDGVEPESFVALKVLPEHFADQALGPVSADGVPQFLRRHQTQPRDRPTIREQEQREMPALQAEAPVEDVLELHPTPDPLILREAAC
jgi:hypothetical protein